MTIDSYEQNKHVKNALYRGIITKTGFILFNFTL